MTFRKKKRSLSYKLKETANDAAMAHKRLIRKIQKKYDLSNYQLQWIAFAKGLILGLIIL